MTTCQINEKEEKPISKHSSQVGLKKHLSALDYLKTIGVSDIPRATSPFDPGYDMETLKGHLEQSHHLMSILKLSMACWIWQPLRLDNSR